MYKRIFKFTYQYLEASMTLLDALLLVQKRVASKTYKKKLDMCIGMVREGKGIYVSLQPIVVMMKGGVVVSSILKSAESSGDYASACKKIYEYLESHEDIKKEFLEVTTYPILISTVSILISYGIVSFIFPKIIPLFTSFGVPIPLPTRIILSIVSGVETYFVLILLMCSLVFVCIRYVYGKYGDIRVWIQKILLHIPGIQKSISIYTSIVVSGAASILISSGKTVFDTLHTVYEDVRFDLVRNDFLRIIEKQEQGILLSTAFEESGFFRDAIWVDLLLIGEKTGRIQESFRQIHKLYLEELMGYKRIVKVWSEPVLMFCIALIVLFVALSVIQPMYSIVNHVSNT